MVRGSLQEVDSPADFSFKVPIKLGKRGVLLLDNEHRIRSADRGFCELFGVCPSNLIGQDRTQVMQHTISLRFKNPKDFEESCQVLYKNPNQVLDDVLEVASPKPRFLHRYSTPLFDNEGMCIGRIEVYSDITHRRELEQRVRQAYEELKATQDQLIQSEKLRAVGEIASGVAHDFNNILGIILGNVQLLTRITKDEVVLARLNSIERAALDAAETVRRIRDPPALSLKNHFVLST